MKAPRHLSALAVVAAVVLSSSPPFAVADVLLNEINAGASERLLRWDANGVPQVGTGVRWYEAAFSDTPWASAVGPFGYGSISGASVAIATNLQPQVQYLTPTVYYRRNFSVSAGDQVRTDPVQLIVEYNDGFVAYLNGVEIARRNGGPANKFIYHDQPAYNREAFSGTAPIPTTTQSETISIGAANTKLLVGNNVLAIHHLNASASDGTAYLKASLQISGSPIVPLVNYNDSWKYFPGIVEPSGNVYDPAQLGSAKQFIPWGTTVYDDLSWLSGAGPFGFGTGSPNTNTQGGMQNITPSLYQRVVFNVAAAQAADTLPLKLVVGNDDGFVAYINGVEVARRRIGIPNTFTPYDAVADSSQSSVQNETILLDAPSKLLVAGSNVLSIQAHNYTKSDADFYMSASLQTNAGTTLVANNGTWKYRYGTSEPVTPNPDGEEEDSAPEGPDSATDWVELYNNGGTAVSLSGWHLTDDSTNPTKWTFPDVTIPAGGFLVVICDNKDITAPPANGYLHTNFKLDTDGEYVGLYDGTGALISNLAPTYPPQLPFQGYARDADGTWKYTDLPTPGAANSGPYYSGIVATPTVNNPGRFYSGSVSVTITSATPGATIRYTTDGSVPTASSAIASGALTFTTNAALRARAFLAGYVPSDTITHTYLVSQSSARQSLPAVCLTGDQQQSLYRPFGVFAISPNTTTPTTANAYTGGIWSQFIGNTSGNLTAPNVPPDNTAYNAPMQSGKPAERPVSMEILHTNATADLRTGAFMRCAGSPYSRQRYVLTNHNSATPNSQSPWPSSSTEKPQINLFFRDDLGPSPLSYPLVPGSVVSKYDNIRLRAGKNDITNPFIRDEFTRRLSLDMKQVTVRGDFVNVYVDGVFKGYFNICERPREPFFQEARQSDAKFDVRNITVIVDGDTLAYNDLINFTKSNTANFAQYSFYTAMQTRLDVVNLADYVILNAHAAMADWPSNNYVMDRERTTDGVYRFSVWDAEGGYGGFSRNPAYKIFNDIYTSNVSGESVPTKILYSALRNNAEFRLLCADRIQKHFFNGGALTDTNLQARWNSLAAQIQPIMQEVLGQSVSYATFNQWLSGVGDTSHYTLSGGTSGSIVNCPTRRLALFSGYTDDTAGSVFVSGFFKSEGLWPSTLAPSFSQNGGNVPTGYALTISNPNGAGTTIYYTLNGIDPRQPNTGTPVGTTYSGPITLSQPTTVKARVRNDSTLEWSPLMEATFTTAGGYPLIISELMYNPPAYNLVDGDEFEFIELHNTSSSALNLFGLKFTSGIDYTFPAGSSIPADGYVVLAKNTAQFNAKYPGVSVLGQYGPGTSLNDGGETVTLSDANNAIVFSVTYDDVPPWPTSADGGGYSLVPLNANTFTTPTNASNAAEWRRSTNVGGSPGQIDPINVQAVYINELLANPDVGQMDSVELYNPGPATADISDWWLSDSQASPKKYRFPTGTTIPVNGYLVVTESQFNPTPGQGTSFEFNKNGGEDVVLSSGDSSGNLTGYIHKFTNFPATTKGTSLGPYTDSTNTVRFLPLSSVTFGSANSGIKVGPVVLTEVMYNAPVGKVDFIEIANITNAPVPLFDAVNPGNTWRMVGVEYDFPTGITLQPRQILILTTTDPSSFRTMYSVPASVAVYQYTTGGLVNNIGELVSLQMPAEGQSTPASVYIDVDYVNYKDTSPWPLAADGGGSSLERINWRAFGDDVVNWRASAQYGSPGVMTPSTFAEWQAVYFTPAQIANANYGGSNADPDFDGLTNFWEFALGLNPLVSDSPGAYSVSLQNDGAAGPFLTLQYQRNLGANGLQYHMDTASDVGTWTLDGNVQVGSPVNNGDGTETVTRRDTQSTSDTNQRFLRFRINN